LLFYGAAAFSPERLVVAATDFYRGPPGEKGEKGVQGQKGAVGDDFTTRTLAAAEFGTAKDFYGDESPGTRALLARLNALRPPPEGSKYIINKNPDVLTGSGDRSAAGFGIYLVPNNFEELGDNLHARLVALEKAESDSKTATNVARLKVPTGEFSVNLDYISGEKPYISGGAYFITWAEGRGSGSIGFESSTFRRNEDGDLVLMPQFNIPLPRRVPLLDEDGALLPHDTGRLWGDALLDGLAGEDGERGAKGERGQSPLPELRGLDTLRSLDVVSNRGFSGIVRPGNQFRNGFTPAIERVLLARLNEIHPPIEGKKYVFWPNIFEDDDASYFPGIYVGDTAKIDALPVALFADGEARTQLRRGLTGSATGFAALRKAALNSVGDRLSLSGYDPTKHVRTLDSLRGDLDDLGFETTGGLGIVAVAGYLATGPVLSAVEASTNDVLAQVGEDGKKHAIPLFIHDSVQQAMREAQPPSLTYAQFLATVPEADRTNANALRQHLGVEGKLAILKRAADLGALPALSRRVILLTTL
ncbi:MAG: hypothetical protein OXB87_04775, partial [Hyphomicrobiales bacterium]|nr:hypothetical protein [Hyphomicrobiales bacterium]